MTPISSILIQTPPLRSNEIKSLDISLMTTRTLPSLKEYKNNGLKFYKEFYTNEILGVPIVFFGHDFSGCYGIDTVDNHVKYATQEDAKTKIVFCNSSIETFVLFNNLFIDLVHEKIASKPDDFESKIAKLRNLYFEKDSLAMDSEESFWPIRIYELEEDFFPMDNSRISLFSKYQ